MINWTLVSPRNFVVITAMILIWHVILAPVFNAIGKNDGGNETA